MQRTIFLSMALVLVLWLPAPTHATITYVFSGVGSGSLGTDDFSDAGFAITAIVDETQFVEGPGGFRVDTLANPTIDVLGHGSAAFSARGHLYIGLAFGSGELLEPAVLFGADGGSGLYVTKQNFFELFDPDVRGTVERTEVFIPVRFGIHFPTDAGEFRITSITNPSYFEAIRTVPEPSTSSLLGTGVIILVSIHRKRRRSGCTPTCDGRRV